MESNRLPVSPVLEQVGLRLLACVSPESLSKASRSTLEPFLPRIWTQTRLVVIGHAGRELWPAFEQQRDSFASESPLDDYSLHHGRRFLESLSEDVQAIPLYPSEHFFPLPPILRDVGWSRDSLLGLGIHEEWGLWQAVRAVFLVEADWPEVLPSPQTSPCLTCVEKPCISGCLGSAMAEGGLMLDSCLNFRLQEESPCALQCAARLSCPVGAEHRYSREQRAFHDGHSLEMIRRWKRGEF